jgi:hypothetical protein
MIHRSPEFHQARNIQWQSLLHEAEIMSRSIMKTIAVSDVTPCRLVEFRALMMEEVSTSEISVNIYQTTRRNIQLSQ